MLNHDVKPGALGRCQITGSEEMFEVIDLGHQPPCDAILRYDQLAEPEVTYPLSLNLCPSSGLAQLGYVVEGVKLYPKNYPYRAGVSQTVVDAHREMAAMLKNRFNPVEVVDIGCNDGTLLTQFLALGCTVRGVEPTDVATYAPWEAQVVQDFFTEEIAKEMVHVDGQADLITMTHVFAHMADLGEVMRGIRVLLKPDGVLVVENQYLLDVLEKDQFDTIYHEHVRTYSLKALMVLFAQYGMVVFDVERVSRYGGNIRAYVCRTDAPHPKTGAVKKLAEHEVSTGLFEEQVWRSWRSRVLMHRDNFMEWICKEHRMGARIAGCSAAGRAATLLNFYGVTRDLLPYTGEVANSLKLGCYYPGCHIPIIANTQLLHDQPDYIVFLAWHYRDYIARRLRKEGLTGNFVSPLPSFHYVA